MSDKITIKVESASEFREKQKHAEALGLSLKKARFGGNWVSDDGTPVFLNGGVHEIEKIGHKYFYLPIGTANGTEVVPCKPALGGSIHDAGHVHAVFTGLTVLLFSYSFIPSCMHSEDGESPLEVAQETVGARAEEYGPPDENFEVIANLWEAYLGVEITKYDYAQMMVLAKIGRARTGDPDFDTHTDQCGYSYLAELVKDDTDYK